MPKFDAIYWRKLRDMLASYYSNPSSIRAVCLAAGLDIARLPLSESGRPVDMWMAILEEARKSNRSLLRLNGVVLHEYGDDADLREMLSQMPATESVAESVEIVDKGLQEVLTRLDGLDRKMDNQTADLLNLRKSLLEWATGR